MLGRLAVLTLIGVVLLTVAVLYTVSPPEPAPASCEDPDEHHRAGRLKLAEEAYSAILEDDSEAACAIKGLMDTQCLRADAIVEQLPTEAEKRYLTVLTRHPHATCAADGLRMVATVRCDRAEQLRVPILAEEAVKAYAALLDLEPRPDCVPEGLKQAHKLSPKQKTPAPEGPVCCCCGECREPHDENGGPCDG